MSIKIFNSPFKVTQVIGNNPSYYAKWGLKGHEGLDLIPTGSDWTVFSLPFKGVVVRDIDMADKGGNYGITNTVWYPSINEAWQYCHLASNRLFEGQEIGGESPVGTMGNTGNTTGPHLHLNRFEVDSLGRRQNRDNGYLGGIDPLPFLLAGSSSPEPIENTKYTTDQMAAFDTLINYRLSRVLGPEGNFQGFVSAIIGNDMDISGKNEDLASAKKALIDQAEAYEKQIETVRESGRAICTAEKSSLERDWQLKVDGAKKSSVGDLTVRDLVSLFITKILNKGGEGNG